MKSIFFIFGVTQWIQVSPSIVICYRKSSSAFPHTVPKDEKKCSCTGTCFLQSVALRLNKMTLSDISIPHGQFHISLMSENQVPQPYHNVCIIILNQRFNIFNIVFCCLWILTLYTSLVLQICMSLCEHDTPNGYLLPAYYISAIHSNKFMVKFCLNFCLGHAKIL